MMANRSGQFISAESAIAIEHDLHAAIAWHQAGKLDQACECYQSVLDRQPDHMPACVNLGSLLIELGDVQNGSALLNRAATGALIGRDTETLFFIANSLSSAGRLIEARTAYRHVLEIDPQHVEAWCDLAVTITGLARIDEALRSYRCALEIQPSHVRATVNLGILLSELGRLQEAEDLYREALQLNQNEVLFHYNLGIALKKMGKLEQAEESFRYALQISPDFPDAISYLGSILAERGFLTEAQLCYRRVIELKPDSDMARFSLGTVLLASGQYSEGWQHFEHRWSGGLTKLRYPATTLPQWKGQEIQAGSSILIFGEQGLGDRIQFSRFLTQLPERFTGRVSFVVHHSLTRLFTRSFPACEILDAAPTDQQAWQWQCPVMSLPLATGTTLDTLPGAPYLIADPERVQYFAGKIAQTGSQRKIGVVWKSGGKMVNAGLRSLSFEQVACLFTLPGTSWYSLQKEPGADLESIRSSGMLIDWTDDFRDFDDTAALIMQLDLVISVDTAVAHLAGALGKPVWLLNRHASEWRWMRDREDSPWYPSMRIFTQRIPNQWDELICRIAAALRMSPF